MIICFNGSGTYTQNWTQWHICTVYCNSNNNHTACCMQPRQVYKVHTEYLKQITEITVSEINIIMTVTEKNDLHMRDSASSASPPLPWASSASPPLPCSLVEPPPDALSNVSLAVAICYLIALTYALWLSSMLEVLQNMIFCHYKKFGDPWRLIFVTDH